jgi:hypothetical protein
MNMQNNTTENPSTAQNHEGKIPTYREWREQRREWRKERREIRHGFPFHGLFLGMVLVLLGVLFLLNQAGWITGLPGRLYQVFPVGINKLSSRLISQRFTVKQKEGGSDTPLF